MWVAGGGCKDLKDGSTRSSDPSVRETPNGSVITILFVNVCFPLCTKDQASVACEGQDSNQGLLDRKVPSPESGPIQTSALLPTHCSR